MLGMQSGHTHEFTVSGFEVKRKGIIKKNAKLVAELKCTICGYKTSVKIDYGVDVVSVNGKPYFIPRDFFVYSPVALSKTDVKPSVEYAELASGVYVPVKYVSRTVMERLNKLDEEYSMYLMMYKLQIDGADRMDYQTFEEVYKKGFYTAVMQARLLISDLEGRGFSFEVDRDGGDLVIEIKKDGSASYFRVDHYLDVTQEKLAKDISFGFRGKWSLLGTAVFKLVLAGQTSWRAALFLDDPESIKKTRAAAKIYSDGVVFTGVDGDVIIGARQGEIAENRAYIVKYVQIDDKNIAMSYIPDISTDWVENKSKLLIDRTLVEYGRAGLYCRDCNLLIFDVPIERRIPVDIISIDGTLYYVPRDEIGLLSRVDSVERKSDPSPDVEYVKLASGLYVPRHIGSDVMKKLISTTDAKEQAKLLVEELRKSGFELYIDRSDMYWDNIIVIGPDGSFNVYAHGRVFRSEQFMGKWSPLGLAVLASIS